MIDNTEKMEFRNFAKYCMKRKYMIVSIELMLFSMLFGCSLMSQEKWDVENCIYTNHDYNFHWILPKEFEWKKVIPNEKHSVFKAVSPYGMCVFVNANKWSDDENAPDMWDNFDKYKQLYSYVWNLTYERTGGVTTPIAIEKCRFGGEKAIKTIVKNKIEDDVRDEISYGVTYNLHKDRYTWSISFKCSELVWELLSEDDLKTIIAGFGLNAIEL